MDPHEGQTLKIMEPKTLPKGWKPNNLRINFRASQSLKAKNVIEGWKRTKLWKGKEIKREIKREIPTGKD